MCVCVVVCVCVCVYCVLCVCGWVSVSGNFSTPSAGAESPGRGHHKPVLSFSMRDHVVHARVNALVILRRMHTSLAAGTGSVRKNGLLYVIPKATEAGGVTAVESFSVRMPCETAGGGECHSEAFAVCGSSLTYTCVVWSGFHCRDAARQRSRGR